MKTLTHLDPILVPPDHGKVWSVLGQVINIKLTSELTGGICAVAESISPPHSGPPLHIHHREDETFWILEGYFEIQCGDRKFNAGAGATVFLPRNVPHTFLNLTDEPSRLLVTITPGGFEGFFEDVGRLTAQTTPVLEDILRIANKYDLEIIA